MKTSGGPRKQQLKHKTTLKGILRSEKTPKERDELNSIVRKMFSLQKVATHSYRNLSPLLFKCKNKN